MDADFAFICDHCQVSGQKVSALGIGLTAVEIEQVPAHPDSLFFVALLRATPDDAGQRLLTLTLTDPDNRECLKLPIPVQIPFPYPGTREVVWAVADIQGVQFLSYGTHVLELHDDETLLSTVTFDVVRPRSRPTSR